MTHMQAQPGGGSIVNIASVSATRASPGTAAYGAAKAGLLNLTQSLAMEWGPKVRVNAIIAGLVATGNAEAHYGGPAGSRVSPRVCPRDAWVSPRTSPMPACTWRRAWPRT